MVRYRSAEGKGGCKPGNLVLVHWLLLHLVTRHSNQICTVLGVRIQRSQARAGPALMEPAVMW